MSQILPGKQTDQAVAKNLADIPRDAWSDYLDDAFRDGVQGKSESELKLILQVLSMHTVENHAAQPRAHARALTASAELSGRDSRRAARASNVLAVVIAVATFSIPGSLLLELWNRLVAFVR